MLQADVYADFYLKPLLIALALEVLPDTPEIALLSCSSLFQPGRKIDHGSRDAACLARAGHHLVSRTNGSAQLSPRAPGCNEVHAGKPSLMRAGWKAPIHDSSAGGARGDVEGADAEKHVTSS